MARRILTLTFNTKVHENEPRFVIPADVRAALGLGAKSRVGLIVFGGDDLCRYVGVETLKSGPEIYGVEIRSALIPGEEIQVTAFRPPRISIKS